MSSTGLQVDLPCTCGRVVAARAHDAGNKIECACGKLIDVPLLSRLRKLAGKDAYVTNPAEAIRKQVAAGTKPAGNKCVACGATSPVEYECLAVCESQSLKHTASTAANDIPRQLLHIMWFVLLGWLFYLLGRWVLGSFRRDEGEVIVGNDVHVSFQLPVCDSCSAAYGDVTRPKVAKQLMELVPVYAELLKFYPEADLTVERK